MAFLRSLNHSLTFLSGCGKLHSWFLVYHSIYHVIVYIFRFPFYFESKIIFLFWLISPYGNGAKILYENFVHKKIEQNEEVSKNLIQFPYYIYNTKFLTTGD